MQVSFESNIREWTRTVGALQRQVPFATAKALTDTARLDCKPAGERLMRRRLDDPTPFTLKGIGTTGARKSRLVSSVFIKDRQAEYLRWQQGGGTQKPKRRAIPIPVNQRRNKYGNMPKGTVQRLLARPDTFSGRINGVGGIWQRRKPLKSGKSRPPKLLVRFTDQTQYRPRLGFQKEMRKVAIAAFPARFARSWTNAIRTARR